MSREAHVRFWEGVGVKLPRATHFLVLSETHLRRLLRAYLAYYHGARTHLSLEKDAPEPDRWSAWTRAGSSRPPGRRPASSLHPPGRISPAAVASRPG